VAARVTRGIAPERTGFNISDTRSRDGVERRNDERGNNNSFVLVVVYLSAQSASRIPTAATLMIALPRGASDGEQHCCYKNAVLVVEKLL
jgi:hypothetical protein